MVGTDPAVGRARGPDAVTQRPVYKKWWLWTAVAVVAVGGGTAAVLLAHRDKHPAAEGVSSPNSIDVMLNSLRGP